MSDSDSDSVVIIDEREDFSEVAIAKDLMESSYVIYEGPQHQNKGKGKEKKVIIRVSDQERFEDAEEGEM